MLAGSGFATQSNVACFRAQTRASSAVAVRALIYTTLGTVFSRGERKCQRKCGRSFTKRSIYISPRFSHCTALASASTASRAKLGIFLLIGLTAPLFDRALTGGARNAQISWLKKSRKKPSAWQECHKFIFAWHEQARREQRCAQPHARAYAFRQHALFNHKLISLVLFFSCIFSSSLPAELFAHPLPVYQVRDLPEKQGPKLSLYCTVVPLDRAGKPLSKQEHKTDTVKDAPVTRANVAGVFQLYATAKSIQIRIRSVRASKPSLTRVFRIDTPTHNNPTALTCF